MNGNTALTSENHLGSAEPYWPSLRYHPTQAKLWISPYRFNVVPAGRRSGKTEIAGKRRVIRRALRGRQEWPDFRSFIAAPTRDQVKRIYWSDLKNMVPSWAMRRPPSESSLTIFLYPNALISLIGMDRPERIEGPPWDHGVLDEYGNMKPETWPEHVRPALSDRFGTCDFIGVPEGRNHYYSLAEAAQDEMERNEGGKKVWGYYHWFSADILPPEEIEQAKRDLDPLTYQQEYEGAFISFTGMAYYQWDEVFHVGRFIKFYDPKRPLVLALDFNVDPGVAAILQEIREAVPSQAYLIGKTTTACIGEVWIEKGSNTIKVCSQFLKDWGNHEGDLYVYGDATGGARGSAKVKGSDWDLVKQMLYPRFGRRVHFRVPKSNPRERARINAVNSRLKNMMGEIFLVVDGRRCPNIVNDFGGVRLKGDGSGEIDKAKDPTLSHLSDAIGYYVAEQWPIRRWESSGQRYWK